MPSSSCVKNIDDLRRLLQGGGDVVFFLASGFGTSPQVWEEVAKLAAARLKLDGVVPVFVGLPFWLMLPSSSGGFNLAKAIGLAKKSFKAVVVCGWSCGGALALQVLGKTAGLVDNFVLAAFSPRMLRGDGYTGFRQDSFAKMKALLADDRLLFLTDFFNNVCSYSTLIDANRPKLLAQEAALIDERYLESCLGFLSDYDIRDVAKSLALVAEDSVLQNYSHRTKVDANASAPLVYIIYSSRDSVSPPFQSLYCFCKDPRHPEPSPFKGVELTKLGCGHDVLFEAANDVAGVVAKAGVNALAGVFT